MNKGLPSWLSEIFDDTINQKPTKPKPIISGYNLSMPTKAPPKPKPGYEKIDLQNNKPNKPDVNNGSVTDSVYSKETLVNGIKMSVILGEPVSAKFFRRNKRSR